MDHDGIRPIVVGEFSEQPILDSIKYRHGGPTSFPWPQDMEYEEELALNEGSPSAVVRQVRLENIVDPDKRQKELERRFQQALLNGSLRSSRG